MKKILVIPVVIGLVASSAWAQAPLKLCPKVVTAADLPCDMSTKQTPDSAYQTEVYALDVKSLPVEQAPPKLKGNKVVRFLVGPWRAMFTDWKMAVSTGALAAGLILDGESTVRLQRRRPGAVELNPLLPDHPKPRHVVAYFGVLFVGQTYAHWGLRKLAYDPANPKSKWSLVADAYPVILGVLHGDAARKNYNLITCPSGSFKPPGLPGCVLR